MLTPAPRRQPPRGPVPRLAAVAILGSLLSWAEILVGPDGSRTMAPRFRFGNGQFTSESGPAPARADVVDWWFTEAATAEAAPVQADSGDAADLAALQELRALGQAAAARFPGCQGVQVLDDGQFTLTQDHRHLYRYRFAGLILNEALLKWGQIELGFSEGRSRCRVRLARCLDAAGRLHVLDPKEVKVSRPSGEAVSFDPNNRLLSATVPGAEVGSLIEYVYEYENYAPEDWRLFFPGFYFQSEIPVCRSTFTVQVPASEKLYSWEENWSSGRSGRDWWGWLRFWRGRPYRRTSVTEDGAAYHRYVWEKRDVPPVVAEPEMPPLSEITPAVHATLFRDWDHINRLTGGMQRERMALTPEIEKQAKALTADCATTDERIARLYHWVQKNIRYISVKSSLSSGWSGHPAAETYAQGYGDCTDKSVLFCTMLQVVGVEAEPVVLRTNDAGRFVPRYPVLACNHCITEVRAEGKRQFLDCTTQDQRYPSLRADDHGVLALNFIRGEIREIPVPPGQEGLGKIAHDEMDLALDGTLKVHTTNRYGGMYEAGLRAGWKRVPEKLRPQVMQQHLNGIAPGARLGAFSMPDPENLDEPFRLEYEYQLPKYVSEAGALRLFQFPDRERTFPEVGLETRRYPLAYLTSEGLERHVVLRLPPCMRVVDLPAAVRLGNRYVAYSETYRQDGHQVVLEIRFERHSRQIPAADYRAYRQLLQRIEQVTRKVVYLELAE